MGRLTSRYSDRCIVSSFRVIYLVKAVSQYFFFSSNINEKLGIYAYFPHKHTFEIFLDPTSTCLYFISLYICSFFPFFIFLFFSLFFLFHTFLFIYFIYFFISILYKFTSLFFTLSQYNFWFKSILCIPQKYMHLL